MPEKEVLTYTICLLAAAQAGVTALLLALHGMHAGVDRFMAPAAFLLLGFVFSAGVLNPLHLYGGLPLLAWAQIAGAFLVAPALYGFVNAVSPFEAYHSKFWPLHFAPTLIVGAIFLPLFTPATEATAPQLAGMVPQLWPFLAAQAALYLAVSLHAIFRDVKRLDDIFSFHGSEPEKRLKRLLVMLTLPWILLVAELALDAALTLEADTKAVLAVVRVACIFAVCVMAVFPSPLVPTPKHPVPATEPEPKRGGTARYQRSAIDTASARRIVAKLESLMQEQQFYLNAFLTLQELSTHSGVPTHKLSQALNVHLGKSFFDYVNEWRVRHVTAALERGSEKTLLTLATEAGFNSKSTFNAAFKKMMGHTPTAFRHRTGVSQGSEKQLQNNASAGEIMRVTE